MGSDNSNTQNNDTQVTIKSIHQDFLDALAKAELLLGYLKNEGKAFDQRIVAIVKTNLEQTGLWAQKALPQTDPAASKENSVSETPPATPEKNSEASSVEPQSEAQVEPANDGAAADTSKA